jgi:hypothetical protein
VEEKCVDHFSIYIYIYILFFKKGKMGSHPLREGVAENPSKPCIAEGKIGRE